MKICGVTNLDDVEAVVRSGADAIGFNFWPRSKRYVAPEDARALVRALPPSVTPFGVFVDATREALLRAAEVTGVKVLQLHGDEPPELVSALPLPAVKAIRVEGPASLALLSRYDAAAFLLDAPSAGYGGSGERFDWAIAREAARLAPVLLAGGLTPDNVAEAVRAVAPLGVDVASGVEAAPGRKDAAKITRFVSAARAAAKEHAA